MDINKRGVVVALVFFMLVISSFPQVPASAQLQHCTNTGFADAIRNKAAALQGLGGMIEGPFAIGGGNFASYWGRPKFVDAFFENGAIFWTRTYGIVGIWGYVYQCWSRQYDRVLKTSKYKVFYIVSGADLDKDGNRSVVYYSGNGGKLFADKDISQCRQERRID